jgi:brefeldin A-inhibited guanine nucleotide-exchange protein
MALVDSLNLVLGEGLPQIYNTEERRHYFIDAVIIFKSICKLCLKEVPTNMNTFTMRSKILGLELILGVIEKPGKTFLIAPEFLEIIKGTLCDGILKHCVSSEKAIFARSVSIFYSLFVNFRHHLKAEVQVFLDQIFLKILSSSNSSFDHKYLILNIFENISGTARFYLEIFANYDVEVEAKDLLKMMIKSVARIA